MASADLGVVLVTGGAGFIGCALSQQLANRASRWIVMDNMHPQVHATPVKPEALHESAELIIGDVTVPDDWERVMAEVRPDTVFHFAAETGTAQSLNEASRHSRVNVVGTTEMLDAFGRAQHVPGRFFLSSSRAVYGEGRWERNDGTSFYPGQRSHAQLDAGQWDFPDAISLPSDAAETLPSPTSVYGATKLAQEHVLRAWTRARDTELTVLRLQNVYGPGQSLINSYTGIVSLFSQWAREGREIPIYEDGDIVRDFVFIDDVVAAFVAATARSPRPDDTAFDIGFGEARTILDAATIIADYYSAPKPKINGAYRDGDVRKASCTIDRSVTQLAWKPQWNLERGLAALQEWINAEILAGKPTVG